MAWWKYKALFEIKWREPYGFTQLVNKLQEKYTPWWVRPFWGFVASAVLFVLWNSTKSEGISTVLVLFTSFAVGFTIIYFNALVHRLVSREIGFGEKALVTMAGLCTRGWPYERMGKVEFAKQTFREKEFDVMLIIMVNSTKLIVAVPENVDLDKVMRFLKSKGVEAAQIAPDRPPDRTS